MVDENEIRVQIYQFSMKVQCMIKRQFRYVPRVSLQWRNTFKETEITIHGENAEYVGMFGGRIDTHVPWLGPMYADMHMDMSLKKGVMLINAVITVYVALCQSTWLCVSVYD